MTEFRYHGTYPRTWPQHSHPERQGVLQADPDEIIDFGDREPPDDESWSYLDGDNWVTWRAPAPEPAEDEEPAQAQGQPPGTIEDPELNPEE